MLNKAEDGGIRVVNFNAAVYGLNAIKRATCKFQRYLGVLVEQHGKMNEVWLIPNASGNSMDTLVRDFCSEVLDQELRERVLREMAGVRKLLLAQAFSTNALAGCA